MRRLVLIALAVIAVAPGGARATPVTQDLCPGTATVTTFASTTDVLENLLFANGHLWLSDSSTSTIRRINADGSSDLTFSAPQGGPGAMVQGADGLVYSNWGDAIGGAEQRSHAAAVIRFDPAGDAGTLHPETIASGFNMANGMAMAPNGDIYVSDDVDTGLVKIPHEDPSAWTQVNDTWGTNGLAIVGNTLYSNITFDARSPIEATDLTTGAHYTAFELTAGAASLQPTVYTDDLDPAKPVVGVKGLDDITTDGTYLYPVANGMGELLRVDIARGTACLIASGLQNPSSVRIAPEDSPFADHDPATIDFYTSEFGGSIHVVRFSPK